MNVTILNYLFLKIMMNIIIVEDNIKFAEVLKEYLELELKHNVVCVFTNGNEFLENISKCFADMVLIDINMPFMNGYEIGKKYNFINWNTHMIIITMSEESLNLNNLILNGFKGAILKKNLYIDLPIAIEKVMNGEYYFPGIK